MIKIGWNFKDWLHISIIFILFLLHQIIEKIFSIHNVWIDSYLDPLLCMPLFLSALLLQRRILFYKNESYILPKFHIFVAFIFVSIWAELIFPYFNKGFTADFWDIVLYLIGCIYFYIFLNKSRI